MGRFITLLLFCAITCLPDAVTVKPQRDYSNIHKEAHQFCKAKNFHEGYYFLVDLSIHSGRDRFFVYDFKQKKITRKNLVTHGSCDVFDDNADKYNTARFDNRDNSHCSSIGKYKVGRRDYSSGYKRKVLA